VATLTLTKTPAPRHRVTVWTLERRMFDGFFPNRVTGPGKHVAPVAPASK
jgi:hypothetical protein